MSINLINNIAFLIALLAAGQVVVSRLPEDRLNRQVLFGLLFGGAAILVMANPVSISPGIIFDGRSIVLAVAGVAGGWVTAVIAAGMAAVYRYQLGGVGATLGVMVALFSALFGAMARQWWLRRAKLPRPIDYLALGLVVQLMQLAALTQASNRVGYAFIEQTWWVLLLIYPLATMLLCLMFRNVERQAIDKAALQSTRDKLVAEEHANLQRFRAYFEHSSIGFAITSVEKEWLEVNDALCAALGYTREELSCLTWAELTCPADLSADQMQFDRMLAGEINSYDVEKRFIHKDGHLVGTHLVASLVRRSDGSHNYIVAVVEDISKREQMENALRESAQLFQSTLDGLSANIAVLDEAGEIVYTNKAYKGFAEHNGIAPAVVSENVNYLSVCNSAQGHDSEYAHAFLQGLRDVMAGKQALFELEYPCHSADEQRWFIARVTQCSYGVSKLVIVAHESITSRKQAEQSLAESQAAALVEQRRAQLAALNLMEDAVAARQQAEAVNATLAEQVRELQRWQTAMLGREDRIITVKQEVNELLARLGQPARYGNQLPAQPDGGDV